MLNIDAADIDEQNNLPFFGTPCILKIYFRLICRWCTIFEEYTVNKYCNLKCLQEDL